MSDKLKFKPYFKNPRQITKKQVGQLKDNLIELGDLSGIIHNIETDEIIGGNQRSKIIDIKNCEIEIVESYYEPTKTGTVAIGFVIWNGEKLNYRQVRWTAAQCEQANITANKLGGSFDFDILANDFELPELVQFGFEAHELLGPPERLSAKEKEAQAAEQLQASAFSGIEESNDASEIDIEFGDIIEIKTKQGNHRLMCGDVLNDEQLVQLMDGKKADFVHTTMIEHSNQLESDAFQLMWIHRALLHSKQNVSMFIWGNAHSLWRIWYKGGLSELENGCLSLLSEIVWHKVQDFKTYQPQIGGENWDIIPNYPCASERALFLSRGNKGETVRDKYFEGWNKIRLYLKSEFSKLKWSAKKVNEICGIGGFDSWTETDNFKLIAKQYYIALQKEADGIGLEMPYSEIEAQANEIKREHQAEISKELASSYFEICQSNVSDVWMFPCIAGTESDYQPPKPIALSERAIETSTPINGIVFDPLLTDSSNLIAAHQTSRLLYGMVATPKILLACIKSILKVYPKLKLTKNGKAFTV
jgi:hypothetical protein